MDPGRPHLSITLPKNFHFRPYDSQPPRTPEPEVQPEEPQPPPPPRPVLKVRRRRTRAIPTHHVLSEATEDRPIPTIEAPEPQSDVSMELPTIPSLGQDVDNGYLSPVVSFPRMISPPKTPISQMRHAAADRNGQHWSDMDQASQSETSSRPTSSGGFSDSSISSRGSLDSFPSLGGSCTSPEDEMTDPFSFLSPDTKYRQLSSPLAPHQPSAPAPKKFKLRAAFTEEMDHHLWMTYMTYLQDPTVTPFKALPSTVPPNGVCHRVARMARKTWRGPRASSCRSLGRPMSVRCGTPDTIKPAKSGSSTPIPGSSKPYPRFPGEKQCRKRLRDLAKQKPSLSAHYQRLLNHRSPSPFQSSPQEPQAASQSQSLSSPFIEQAPSFSTRDMNVSLATSTAASMQFGNPLSQLTSEATPRPSDNDRSGVRSSAHQKSQSLHIGLGIGIGNILGSSFARMSEMTDTSISQHNAQTWHASSGNPPRLGSPFQLHAPRPISRPFRRRALHNFEEQARSRGDSFVNQIFGAPAESSHRRVRSRGFSLGDMMEGARRLPLSTTGPSELNPFANIVDVIQENHRHTIPEPEASHGQGIIRLGSPFGGRPSNTFPRAATSHGFEPPASFEQRFAGLPNDSNYVDRS